MELARMFATLGFKVDQTGLKDFEDSIRGISKLTSNLSENLKDVGEKLDDIKKKVSSLNTAINLDGKNKKTNEGGVANNYSRLGEYIEKVDKANESIIRHAPTLITSLDNIRAATEKGAKAWQEYAKNIKEAKEDMRTFKQSISDLRRGTGNVSVNNKYYGGGGGGVRSPFPTTQQPQESGTSLMMLGGLGGMRNFFRSMTPATALAGGAASAGFAVKEVIQSGREVQKMNQALLVSTGGAEKQAQALSYVDREAKRLGISYVELGQAYAKAQIAVGEQLSTKQLEKMLTGVSELATTLNLTQDDQKGVFRAMSQMFTKEKISLEEVNQMAERGIPAYKMMKDAAMGYYKVNNEGFQKLIQKGQVITKEIFPLMAEQMSVMARRGGALEQAIKSDVAAQQRLKNAWDKFSHTLMKSGLSSGLAAIFNGLASIVETLDDFVKGLKSATAGVKAFLKPLIALAEQFPVIAAFLAVVILRLATYTIFASSATARTTALTLATKLYNAALVILRSTIFRVVVVLGLLYKVFNDFNDSFNKGQDNWVTYLSVQFELLFAYIGLASSRLLHFYSLMKLLAKNPIDIGGDIIGNVGENFSIKDVPKSLFERGKQNVTDFIIGGVTRMNEYVHPNAGVKPKEQTTTKLEIINNGKTTTVPLDGSKYKIQGQ